MQNEYIDKLIQQFVNSRGIKKIDVNSEMFKQEFIIWIDQMQKISKGYIELLEMLNIDFNNRNTAEIGKGKYDSIVLNNRSTIMITPYINEKVDNPVACYQFVVSDYRPAIIYDNRTRFINIENIITHNPYSRDNIYNWRKLHNSNSCNITIGIYGNKNDKDRLNKIKMLRDFSNELQSNFNIDGYDYKDNYYLALTTNNKKLKK